MNENQIEIAQEPQQALKEAREEMAIEALIYWDAGSHAGYLWWWCGGQGD